MIDSYAWSNANCHFFNLINKNCFDTEEKAEAWRLKLLTEIENMKLYALKIIS